MTTGKRLLGALKTPMGAVAVVGLVLLLILAVVSPWIWGDQAAAGNPSALSEPPSAQHVFGTDAGGRDVFARTMTATRLSIVMALLAMLIGVALGTVLGCLPSVTGRRLGRFVTAAVNLAVAFPALLLAIFLSIILGAGSVGAVLAIGFAIAPNYARLANTLSSSVAGRDFVAAAKVLGISRFGILFKHVLPNIREPLIVSASITAGNALIAFAGLSFLGLGVQPPAFDWGRMLNEGLSRIYVNPATALAPGVAVIVAGLLFNLFGETIARSLGLRTSVSRRLPKFAALGGVVSPGGAAVGAPHTAAGPAPEPLAAGEPVLSVRNLRVAVPAGHEWGYPVKGVSFDVAPGEIVGIVGESGSGKSLTCLSAAGLTEEPLRVTADSLRFEGVELSDAGLVPSRLKSRRLARLLGTRLALVFQDPMSSLNPAITIGAQIAEIGTLHEGMSRSAARRRALERMADVRIPEPRKRARQYPHEFSGGMRQRAMIAMGLMGSPALIIADEPTTALDVTVQREVLGLLEGVRRDLGSAILLISHDMAVITGMCSRVLVMYDGRIVEEITTPDLVAGRARHPYTRALLAAVPTMTGERGRPLATIPEGQRFDVEPAGPEAAGETDDAATAPATSAGGRR